MCKDYLMTDKSPSFPNLHYRTSGAEDIRVAIASGGLKNITEGSGYHYPHHVDL